MERGCRFNANTRGVNPMHRYNKVVILGVGLLGGSVGLALRHRRLANTVVGVGRSLPGLQLAAARGAVTEITQDLQQACQGADLIVIGTPVQTIAELVKSCCHAATVDACLITDVGSTKHSICAQLDASDYACYCGSHPMAGGEKTGVAYASHDLFLGKRTIITPIASTAASSEVAAEQLWRSLDSDVVRMSPLEHDQAVACVSHLPHIVAATLAAATDPDLLPLAASGWADATRIAGGDVEMWRQIISENRQPILSALRGYSDKLAHWITAIESNDQAAITAQLQQAKVIRDASFI